MTNKIDKRTAITELWFRGVLSWKLDKSQKELYELFYNYKHKIQTWLLARRSGKCLKFNTLIMTPGGPKPINEFKKGDLVYGYNNDGTLSITPVIDVIYSGTKKIRDITSSNKVLASSTDDHKWLWTKYDGKIDQKKLGEVCLKTNKLTRYFIDAPMGNKSVEQAYAIGAFLGDGCSVQHPHGNQLYFSSENDVIPKKLAQLTACSYFKSSPNNYTWVLSTKSELGVNGKRSSPIDISFYDEWCRNRYAHEKIIDLNEIKTWNRRSLLNLLAGLLDTDGSVSYQDNRLTIRWQMQSKSIIESIQWLLLSLFQFRSSIYIDKREKYVNGPCYSVAITSNVFSKRALRELDEFLVIERKKWKKEYEIIPERNNKEEFVGVKLGDYYEDECYDLSIDNETHMYATADGLITHNTYTLVCLALEQCIKKSNSIVKFLSPTRLQVKNNVRPLFRKILEDCPKELKPEFKESEYIFYFPNGSEIQLAGTDNGHAEKLRGGDADLVIIDEAGSCKDLKYIIDNILLPTTLITKGSIILASTPPEDSEHDFIRFIERCEMDGSLIKKTVYDNPRLTKEDIDDLIKELGGINTEAARREMFCEIIKDPHSSAIPEFTAELEAQIVKEWPKPPHYDSYVSMDLGGKDLTAVLFAYYDFRADKIIIEDELIMDFRETESNIEKLSKSIEEKEKNLWTNYITNELKSPYLRVSDINYIVINEIYKYSNGRISFNTTKKDDVITAVNNLRVMLSNKKIIINPRCITLLRHLKNVKWDNKTQKSSFSRSPDCGHYDTVDALKYLIRNIVYTKNPYPANYNMNMRDLHIQNPEKFSSLNHMDVYRKIFNTRKKNHG